jgi:hypothetical protein
MAERRTQQPQETEQPANAEQLMRVQVEARKVAAKMNETVEGGRYRTADGSFVDANGEPVNEKSE